MKAILYVHGKNGNAKESERYKPLFTEFDVFGLDYKTSTPWEAGKEIHDAVVLLKERYQSVFLIANSIGAYFSMNADLNGSLEKAYFISPIVDMEKLIRNMMERENVTEYELRSKGFVQTSFGETLSWTYLKYVQNNPIDWTVPTSILYGSDDDLTSFETIFDFAKTHDADLTVMENGEHWFHTKSQLEFLDNWIKKQKENG